MTTQLFSNNAKTTLAAPVNASQTSITVSTGTGALFPSPAIGQAFKITLVSATSPTVNEICLCTARSGDVLTIVRAQEGTTALPFSVGDIAGNFDTAGVMGALVQSAQLQNQYYQYGVGGGTGNAVTATVPSTLSALTDGMYVTIKAPAANTGAATFNLTLGSTITGVYPIRKGANIALSAGDIPAAGYPMQLNWNATTSAWVLANPAQYIYTPPAGSVIQTQFVTSTTGTNISSLTGSTVLSLSITPTYANSKILIQMNCPVLGIGTESSTGAFMNIARSTTVLSTSVVSGAQYDGTDNEVANQVAASLTGTYMDSPATTSPVLYNMVIGTLNEYYDQGETGTIAIGSNMPLYWSVTYWKCPTTNYSILLQEIKQ